MKEKAEKDPPWDRRLSRDKVIDRVNKKHGAGVIGFDKFVFEGGNKEAIFECLVVKEHGQWTVCPSGLIYGTGCPRCGRIKAARSRLEQAKKTLMERIDKALGPGAVSFDLDEYKGANKHVNALCLRDPSHGYWKVKPANLVSGYGCPMCGDARNAERFSERARRNFVQDVRKVHRDAVEIINPEDYANAHIKLEVSCLRDPSHPNWMAYPVHLKRGVGCPLCGLDKRLASTRDLAAGFGVSLQDRIDEKHGAGRVKVSGGEYINARTPMLFKCLLDDRHVEWWASPHAVVVGSGCPTCSASRGEREISKYLARRGIHYKHQARLFAKYKFDFCLPDEKLIIEFDGGHHFFPVEFSASLAGAPAWKAFMRTNIADLEKMEWCEKNGYRVERIAFCDDLSLRLDEIFSGAQPPVRHGLTDDFSDSEIAELREIMGVEGLRGALDLAPISTAWHIHYGLWRGEVRGEAECDLEA